LLLGRLDAASLGALNFKNGKCKPTRCSIAKDLGVICSFDGSPKGAEKGNVIMCSASFIPKCYCQF